MSQVSAASSNAAQIEYWNSSAGETWAALQEALDRQIEPSGLAAIDVLEPKEGQQMVDIGCGCGQTTLSLASRVGAAGSVVGVDISGPMLEVAERRPRAALNLPVTFRRLDAQIDDLGRNATGDEMVSAGADHRLPPIVVYNNINLK
jgi:cyclopropane fatty-acyl-phospholipid synthase-like methyltransferase